MSDHIKKTIVFIDAETGSLYEDLIEDSVGATVGEMQDLLEIPKSLAGKPLFFYNRCTSVDEEELIGEAYDSDDVVTVRAGALPGPEEEKKDEVSKDIKNDSDYEIIVVGRTQRGWPIFFDGKERKSIKLSKATKSIQLYRQEGKVSHSGELEYKGWTYELDLGENVAFYRYEKDGRLHVYEKDQNSRLVDPVGDEITKRQSDFYQPRREKLRLRFENEGPKHLLVLTGGGRDFDVAQLDAGEGKTIEIKKNRRGFEFGLCEPKEGAEDYQATMFDAQEVANGKLIRVSRETGFKATIVRTDGPDQLLTNTRAKQYREQDRINRKYMIDKAVKIGKAVGKIAAKGFFSLAGLE